MPNSSVLFDQFIPILTGFDRDMWASQLLTLQSSFATITLDFSGTPHYVGVSRVEMVVFNCEQLGASIQTITLSSGSGAEIANFHPNITSCDSLVMVCVPHLTVNSSIRVLSLNFMTINPLAWVYLAAIKVYEEGSECPTSTVINRPNPTTPSGEFYYNLAPK